MGSDSLTHDVSTSPVARRLPPNSVTKAHLEHAKDQVWSLFPHGHVHVNNDAVERGAREHWAGHALSARESGSTLVPPDRDLHSCVHSARREVALSRLGELQPSGGQIIDDGVVERAAGHGWALRAVETRARQDLDRTRREAHHADELSAWIARKRLAPADGHGPWYDCKFSKDIPAHEVACAVVLAQRHPDDLRAQETACRSLTKAAAMPVHLDCSKANSTRMTLASTDGLDTVLASMRMHGDSDQLLGSACHTLWHITEGRPAARSAEAAGAVEQLTIAMRTFPKDEALQWAACAALANIAKHREKDTVSSGLKHSVAVVASALSNHPKCLEVQGRACALLWQLATECPGLLAEHIGLRRLVEHASGMGIREAGHLLECVRWQSPAEGHATTGGGRRRWGQWAVGGRQGAGSEAGGKLRWGTI